MTDDHAPATCRTRPDPQSEAARKRRLDEVFGDVLPDTTSDERGDPGTGGGAGGGAGDRWLREQVPPHHG
jgi:hypothetical protein